MNSATSTVQIAQAVARGRQQAVKNELAAAKVAKPPEYCSIKVNVDAKLTDSWEATSNKLLIALTKANNRISACYNLALKNYKDRLNAATPKTR